MLIMSIFYRIFRPFSETICIISISIVMDSNWTGTNWSLFALQIQLGMRAIEQIVPKVQFGPVFVLFAYALHWPQETEICSTCHEHHFWSPYRGFHFFGLLFLLLLTVVVVVAVGRAAAAAADRRMRWNKFQPRISHVLYAALAGFASGVEGISGPWVVAVGWWFGYHFQCSRPKLFAYKHSLRTFIVSILTSLIKTSS